MRTLHCTLALLLVAVSATAQWLPSGSTPSTPISRTGDVSIVETATVYGTPSIFKLTLNPGLLAYGSSAALRAINGVNGPTSVGTSESLLANHFSFSATGGLTAVQGTATATRLENGIPNRTAVLRGGFFGVTATNPITAGLESIGSYSIAGVTGQLDGAVTTFPSSGVVAAVVGNDNVNANGSYAGYFNGKGFFSGRVTVVGPGYTPGSLQVRAATGVAVSAFATDHFNGTGAHLEGGRVGALGFGGHYTSGSTPSQTIGVWGVSLNSGPGGIESIGVHGDAHGGQFAKGVAGSSYGGANSQQSYGVYGDTPATAGWSGYFNGDVFVKGQVFELSDERFKTNVRAPEAALPRLMALRPVAYEHVRASALELAEGTHQGLLAAEVKKVYPGLVKKGIHPPKLDEKGSVVTAAAEFESVDYLSLVPILLKGLQEQQETIEKLQARIAALEGRR